MKSKSDKELEKRMAFKKTVNELNKQINKLTDAERTYLNIARKAKENNLSNQYSLAISGLRSTVAQKKRVQEMLLNFEIMNQSKDVALMTTEFLKGMGSLSKDMMKLCDEKQYNQVLKQFNMAMLSSEKQEQQMQLFMENSKDSFENIADIQCKSDNTSEIEELIGDSLLDDNSLSLDELEKKLCKMEQTNQNKE